MLGSRNTHGAERKLMNLLADAGMEAVTPALVTAVCVQYGVLADAREQVVCTIFRSAAEKCVSRGEVTEQGALALPAIAESLGLSPEDATKLIASVMRARKRTAKKARQTRDRHAEYAETELLSAPSTAEESEITEAVKCPECQSEQIAAGTKGFGLGKAALGAFALGPVGLLGGLLGSKKVTVSCLKCGHSWQPGI
jgi:hypothetical protein